MMDLWNPQYQNDLTIEGGGSKVAYMIAASQYHQKGYTPGNFFDRYTLRSNVQAHPLEWLKTGVNLNLSLSNTQQNPNWGSAANGMSNYTSGGPSSSSRCIRLWTRTAMSTRRSSRARTVSPRPTTWTTISTSTTATVRTAMCSLKSSPSATSSSSPAPVSTAISV